MADDCSPIEPTVFRPPTARWALFDAYLQWDESVAWNSTMAGVVMAFIPTTIVLMLGYRQLVQGLTAGAIKG